MRSTRVVSCVVAVLAGVASIGVLGPAGSATVSNAAAISGPLVGWGENADGQLGDGTTRTTMTPVSVGLPAGTAVTDLSTSLYHSLAATSTGSVYAWGWNADGQLGDGTTTERSTPVLVPLPRGVKVTAVAAAERHSLAMTSTGSVYAWGDNVTGQLGDGTTVDQTTPVPVDLPAGVVVTRVAAGANHSVAVTSSGAVYAWGWNGLGTLGDGTLADSPTPVLVHLPVGVVATRVAAGSAHTLAVTSTGSVYGWGWNGVGQLGDGTTQTAPTPVLVALPTGEVATSVACGGEHSMVSTANGSVFAWGWNDTGQLGDGTTINRGTPAPVTLPSGVVVTSVAAGYRHSVVVTSSGSMYAWGWNSRGQLGDRTETDHASPVAVRLPTGFVATYADAGFDYTLAGRREQHPVAVPGVGTVAEGDSGTATVQVPITLSNASTQTVTVQWTTLFVPGAPAGQADPTTDYAAASGTVTLPAGETTATVAISVLGDVLTEGNEYIVVSFHDPTNATMGGFWGLGFGVIANDD